MLSREKLRLNYGVIRVCTAAHEIPDSSSPSVAATGPYHHVVGMAKTHPYAEAIYRIITLSGGTFGVKVNIPGTYPTTVSSFATKADAEV